MLFPFRAHLSVAIMHKGFTTVWDDLLSEKYPGNKFRKLWCFIKLLDEFKNGQQNRLATVKKVVSAGGHQSNLMLAAAYLAKDLGVPFLYYTKSLTLSTLKKKPEGNFKKALKLGMLVKEFPTEKKAFQELNALSSPDIIKISRGAHFLEAEEGIEILASELKSFILSDFKSATDIENESNNKQKKTIPVTDKDIDSLQQIRSTKQREKKQTKRVAVIVPSGTGATAFFLHRHLSTRHLVSPTSEFSYDVRVYAVPVVGPQSDLIAQMYEIYNAVEKQSKQQTKTENQIPQIIDTAKKYWFGKLYPEFKNIWMMLKRKGLEVDLIYATKAWKAFMENIDLFKDQYVIFLHTGGISGNSTQLKRYRLMQQQKTHSQTPASVTKTKGIRKPATNL